MCHFNLSLCVACEHPFIGLCTKNDCYNNTKEFQLLTPSVCFIDVNVVRLISCLSINADRHKCLLLIVSASFSIY